MTYANYNDAAERVLDLITKFIVEQDELGLNVDYYRRYVDSDTGQIVVNDIKPENSPIVLYEKDFREDNIDSHLYDVINQIVTTCLPNTSYTGDNDAYELLEDTNNFYYNSNGGVNPYNMTETNLAYISFTQANPSAPTVDTEGTLPCNELNVSDLIIYDGVLTSLSQFIPFVQEQTSIDSTLAEQVLDNTIYELLPGGVTRQEEINRFFATYQKLKGPKPGEQGLPNWVEDYNQDGTPDHWSSQADDDLYTQTHDITYFTDEYGGFIPRLNEDVSNQDVNATQTLQFLRDDLDEYLRDIDSELEPDVMDERPDYENQSEGFIEIRNLNQAIIIRNQEEPDVGIVGNDIANPSYLNDGFTITMWVKFLNRVSSGTLFNYGNPLRDENLNPLGFMLETISINQESIEGSFTDTTTPAENGFFVDNEYERFLRLVIAESDGTIRDSNIGQSFNDRYNTATNGLPASEADIMNTFNYTRVPIDYSEWYFIVASYDPSVNENDYLDDVLNVPEYWLGNYTGEQYMNYTGTGAKCKVEIISRSELLRARGFKA